MEPQKSCRVRRLHQLCSLCSPSQTYIQSIEPSSFKFTSTNELSDFRLIGTSVFTNITTWGTCWKGHKSEDSELICEHNTTQFRHQNSSNPFSTSGYCTTLNCFPKEHHANNMAFRWRIGNKPELSMCPPSPILYFAAACLRHQGDTT